ncbi:MAG: glycosyltransferase, partial [Bacteroidota bacterium]
MNPILLAACVLLLFYCCALLILMVGFARLRSIAARRPTISPDELPSVSLVVAARNEAHNLPRLLHCLFAQEYPAGKLEIIVVDDRSEDGSWTILQKAAEEHPRFRALRVTDLLPDFAPKKRALDLGIRSASGDIILLTDADCT